MFSNEFFSDDTIGCKLKIKYLTKKNAKNGNNLILEVNLGPNEMTLEFDYHYGSHSQTSKALFDILNLPRKENVNMDELSFNPLSEETIIKDNLGKVLTIGTYKNEKDNMTICLATIDTSTTPNKTIKICFPLDFQEKYLLFCLKTIQDGILKDKKNL